MTTAGSLAAVVVALLAGLAGCGQKGPLMLPKVQPAAASASAAAPAQ